MSEDWEDLVAIHYVHSRLKKKKFADRVQMIKKLVELIKETLDGMEAEVAKECP